MVGLNIFTNATQFYNLMLICLHCPPPSLGNVSIFRSLKIYFPDISLLLLFVHGYVSLSLL